MPILRDIWLTYPWVVVTTALAYVYTINQEKVYEIEVSKKLVFKVVKPFVCSKRTWFAAYVTSVLICVAMLQRYGSEPCYAHAICCSCRYVSWAMLICLCSNFRIVWKANHVSNQNDMQDDFGIPKEQRGPEKEVQGDSKEVAERSHHEDLDEANSNSLIEVDHEHLKNIEYDGYLCYK